MTSQPGPLPQGDGATPDGQLVVAVARERDVMAFEVLLHRYERPLFGFIRRDVHPKLNTLTRLIVHRD